MSRIYQANSNVISHNKKKERIYLKSLYNDLIEYCDINKISNLQELFHEYGSPAQIVQEYLSSLNEADLKNCLKRKHIKKILFICFLFKQYL